MMLGISVAPVSLAALELNDSPYSGPKNEPTFFFRADDHILPAVVLECGWSERKEQLLNDVDLLLVGGNGFVRAIIIIVEWTMLEEIRVSGTAELFKRDQNGMSRLENTEVCSKPFDYELRYRLSTFIMFQMLITCTSYRLSFPV